MMTVLIVLAVAVVLAFLYVVAVFNGLVRLRNQKDNAWSQIDVQLKRRHDLIPNLVETVKGYMTHERELLESVTRARSAAVAASGSGPAGMAPAENLLTAMLGQLRVTVENYPDLKASANFLALQEEMASTENRIAFARQYYNDSVMHLNTRVESFPANLVAGLFGFGKSEFFELDDPAARQAPNVAFGG
jgi:LemA protein